MARQGSTTAAREGRRGAETAREGRHGGGPTGDGGGGVEQATGDGGGGGGAAAVRRQLGGEGGGEGLPFGPPSGSPDGLGPSWSAGQVKIEKKITSSTRARKGRLSRVRDDDKVAHERPDNWAGSGPSR